MACRQRQPPAGGHLQHRRAVRQQAVNRFYLFHEGAVYPGRDPLAPTGFQIGVHHAFSPVCQGDGPAFHMGQPGFYSLLPYFAYFQGGHGALKGIWGQ